MRTLPLFLLLACSQTHPLPDAAPIDGGDDDGGLRLDAMLADAGPALPELIVARRDGAMLEFHGLDLDGSQTLLYTAEVGDQRFVRIVPSPDGRYGLVLLDRILDVEGSFERVGYVIDWVALDTTAEPMEAIWAIDSEGVCARAINHQRSFVWRHDSRGVYVTCERWDSADGLHWLAEAATFEVSVTDDARSLGNECVQLAMPTEDGALLIRGCTEGEYWLDDAPFPTGGRVVHAWSNHRALVSNLRVEGSDFVYEDLAWQTRGSSEPLEVALPAGSLLLVPSRLGQIPVGFRPPGGGVVASHRIRTREGWIESALPPCTNTNGVPELVRWSPDASAFTASCREGTFIVHDDGSVVRMDEIELVSDLRWSDDSQHLIHVRSVVSDEPTEPSTYRWGLSDVHVGNRSCSPSSTRSNPSASVGGSANARRAVAH